jgi:hypothetical protein
VVEWLAPIALFWTTTAVYLGGFALKIEGGSGLTQTLGIVTTFALYLVVWAVLRMVLQGAVGTVPAVLFACVIATLLLPILTRVGFRVLGVRISKAAAAHH